MKMSSLFVPTMKESPAQIADPGLAAMIRKGYASFSSEGNRLSFLPLGVISSNRFLSLLEKELMKLSFQPVTRSLSFDGGLSIARGVIQSYRHIPFQLFEESHDKIWLAGYSRDFYTAEENVKYIWKKLQDMYSDLGIELFSWKDVSVHGQRYVIGVESGRGHYLSEKGLVCTGKNCKWQGSADSYVPFAEYPNPSPGKMEEVSTPGIKTIADLCSFLDIEPYQTVKTMLFVPGGQEESIVAALIRGDRNVNETKLAAHLGVENVRPATSQEISEVLGDTEGFLGPAGLPDNIRIVSDKSVEMASDVVIGANKKDFHFKGACWGRDFQVHSMADLTRLESGDKCPKCGAELKETHFTRLGDLYLKVGPQSRINDLTYLDESNDPIPVAFWNGIINVGSLMMTFFRQNNSMPPSLAPFPALITIPSMKNNEAVDLALHMAEQIEKRGCSVLVDDREIRGGIKFADAEIHNLPYTIVVGRGASAGRVELWFGEGKREEVDVDLALEIVTKRV